MVVNAWMNVVVEVVVVVMVEPSLGSMTKVIESSDVIGRMSKEGL